MAFTKTDNGTTVTYDGVGTQAGIRVVVTKDDSVLQITQTVPAAKSNRTWGDIVTQMDALTQ